MNTLEVLVIVTRELKAYADGWNLYVFHELGGYDVAKFARWRMAMESAKLCDGLRALASWAEDASKGSAVEEYTGGTRFKERMLN